MYFSFYFPPIAKKARKADAECEFAAGSLKVELMVFNDSSVSCFFPPMEKRGVQRTQDVH